MSETIRYDVVRSLDEVEIRQYPSYILATVSGLTDNEAFGILFDYISGNNRSRKRIPMTAPVMSAVEKGEKIAMATPVISGGGGFSFVLPQSYEMDTVPAPVDGRVMITLVPPRRVAVIRFKGRATNANVQQKVSRTLAVLKENGLQVRGEPFLMRYNPPFIPGFLRRNEVGAEIL